MNWKNALTHLLIGLALVLLFSAQTKAQTKAQTQPVRPQEMITLMQNTPFDQALRVIQHISNQVVVYPHSLQEPIGVEVGRVSWRQALNRIAAHHGLQYRKRRPR